MPAGRVYFWFEIYKMQVNNFTKNVLHQRCFMDTMAYSEPSRIRWNRRKIKPSRNKNLEQCKFFTKQRISIKVIFRCPTFLTLPLSISFLKRFYWTTKIEFCKTDNRPDIFIKQTISQGNKYFICQTLTKQPLKVDS